MFGTLAGWLGAGRLTDCARNQARPCVPVVILVPTLEAARREGTHALTLTLGVPRRCLAGCGIVVVLTSRTRKSAMLGELTRCRALSANRWRGAPAAPTSRLNRAREARRWRPVVAV